MIAADLKKTFPSLERELVDEMSEVGEIKSIPAGDVIMRTGQNIRSAMLVLEGLVKIYREDEEGNEYFMYYIDSGKACAISLVCAYGAETSGLLAKAVTDASILIIPLQYVDKWIGKYKSWAQFTIGSYRDRFEELLRTIDHIAFRNLDERLVFYLKRHQENMKSNIVNISFTQIAQDLNSSREVISRLMKKLAEGGFVKLHRSHLEIVDLNRVLT